MSILNSTKFDKNTGLATFSMRFPIEYKQDAKVFFDTYQHESFTLFLGKSQKKLKVKEERTCRFCGKSMPDVKFKNDAHFIPEFLGNKEYLSDFECDSCNHKFGDYENDLANFLGLSRTLSMVKGKKGIPTFKSPDKNLIVREKQNGIIDFEEIDSNLNIIKDTNTFTINTGIHSYCSISVFKSLVKIGLSMLPEKNLDEYSETIEYLFNDNSKKYDNSLIFILQHIIPGPFIKFPIALSYKRKLQIKDEPIPNRTFVIYFHNRMIQFFLPFSKNERKINQPNSKVRAASLPPLIDQNWYNKYGKPHMNIIELNQYKKIRDRSEEIRIRYLTAKQE